MRQQSLQTRGVNFAFLFGPPRFVTRDEASKIHGAICDALGHDDITFQYETSGVSTTRASKGFKITLNRKEGRGGFGCLLDNEGPNRPIRLLMTNDWPSSLQHVQERFDMIAKATFALLPEDIQKVMAEARLRAQCDVGKAGALQFMRERAIRFSKEGIDRLGEPLEFASIKLVAASSFNHGEPLAGPRREVTIEVLREDPQSLYIDLMSQWKQVPDRVASHAPMVLPGIRSIDKKPSAYIAEAHDFLENQVMTLGKD